MKRRLTVMKNKKSIWVGGVILAGLTLIMLPSCKQHEHCDAYQGSTRSFKKKHHHAEVIKARVDAFKA